AEGQALARGVEFTGAFDLAQDVGRHRSRNEGQHDLLLGLDLDAEHALLLVLADPARRNDGAAMGTGGHGRRQNGHASTLADNGDAELRVLHRTAPWIWSGTGSPALTRARRGS